MGNNDKSVRTIGKQTEDNYRGGTWAEKVGRRTGEIGEREERRKAEEENRREIRNRRVAAVLVTTKGGKTRTGGVLFEMGNKKEAIQRGREIERSIGRKARITQLRDRNGIRIRGLEHSTTEEEIKEKIEIEEILTMEEREQGEVLERSKDQPQAPNRHDFRECRRERQNNQGRVNEEPIGMEIGNTSGREEGTDENSEKE
ncbi:hypothetical protein WH47_05032 [Habropoda laboriosa]|uniref:Uncharacterized protein n=1 Tax=Habropoda laboriosa TaxID=597456 RepID=A0A0L7QVZ7_9HYME|nr:hypothetical protein WH47_05032 [Habropoda laboriosa]